MLEKQEEIEENNEKARIWNQQTETWMAHAAMMHIPLDGTFELTARCNLSCKMCYVRLQKNQVDLIGRERTADEWIEMGRQALDSGTLYLLITGGEPLLHPEFTKIYTALAQMGFYITLFTNATLIDDSIKALFEKYPPSHIQVTLYGASRETYQKVCGNPDGFDLTLAGLSKLKSVSTKLGIRTTFIRDNVNDMEAIYDLASTFTNEYGINPEVHQAFDDVTNDIPSCRLSPKEILDFDEKYRKYLLVKNKNKVYTKDEAPLFDAREKVSGYELEPVILECLAGKASYSINWEGKMFACNTFSTLYTEPFKEGFLPAFNRLPSLFKNLQKPVECMDCILNEQHACPNCPPKLYVETGNFDKVSSYICSYAKQRHETHLLKGEKSYEKSL